MIARLVSLLGFVSLAAGLAALVLDSARAIATAVFVSTSLGQTWFALARTSFEAFRKVIETSALPVVGRWLWDPVLQGLLALPTWLVFGLLGAILIFVAERSRQARLGPV